MTGHYIRTLDGIANCELMSYLNNTTYLHEQQFSHDDPSDLTTSNLMKKWFMVWKTLARCKADSKSRNNWFLGKKQFHIAFQIDHYSGMKERS